MARLLVLAVQAAGSVLVLGLAGCLGATTPPAEGPLELVVDVSTQSNELFSMPDGTTSRAAHFAKEYSRSDDRPDVVLLPVTILDTKVEVPLNVTCPTVGLVTDHVSYASLGRLDAFGIAGVYSWLCNYDDGNVEQGMKDLGELFDPNSPPPAL